MKNRVQKLDKKTRKEKLDDGWIHVNVLFEIVGNPKGHVEKSLNLFLDNINQDQHIITIAEDVEETIEVEQSKGLFSAAAEVEYLVYGLEKLTWFAFNFMPASIEVKAPGELTFKEKDFSNWMNDLLAKLHEVNTVHTSLKSEHQALVKNLNAAVRNNVLLATDGRALDAGGVAKKVGMSEKAVLPFLDALVKDRKIEKKGKKYKKK
ncbi:hypothetical protein GF367_03430 [Candidatus Woesearchaeota archaeon]|nr:hypothetical protein [Candidatus Woesearchaeota archaeon]